MDDGATKSNNQSKTQMRPKQQQQRNTQCVAVFYFLCCNKYTAVVFSISVNILINL